MSSDKLAVQMYTVREHTKTAADLAATLKKIADIGYPAIQASAIGAMNGETPEVSGRDLRQMLDDSGLRCIATHRPWPNLTDRIDEEIELHQTLGCDYVAIGSVPHQIYAPTLEGYRSFIAATGPVIQKLGAEGIRFGHHNHSQEFFRPEPWGPSLEDLLIDEAPAELMLELDLYWVEHAGLNCVRILERTHGRVPVIHLKDKEIFEPSNEPRMAPIGEGNLDWAGILPACEAAGVDWYAVEQDHTYRDPFDCLKSSFNFLCDRLP